MVLDLTKRLVRDPIYWLQRHLRIEENTFLIILAVVVGLLGGFGAICFRLLIDAFQWLTVQKTGIEILGRLGSLPWWTLLLAPAVGGAIVGPLVHFFAREAKGHGVPEVMEAVALRGGKIRPRVVLVKCIASALSIGTGGSVGREGPIVQIGSAIGSVLGQLLKLPQARLRVMVACGAAAGIAATFNAPFAGVVFAVEVILGSFAITTITPIIISSVIATLICHAFPSITGGNVRAFHIPERFQLVSAWEIPAYFVLGGLAALAALLFMLSVTKAEDWSARLPIPEWLQTPLGGLCLGGIFLLSPYLVGAPHVWGVGYETIEMVLEGDVIWQMALMLVFIKILATALTLGSGGSGGIFAPSLFIGGVLGSAFGHWAHQLFPDHTASSGAYALVGMGAVVAGTTHAPLTAILILFEMTGDYAIILPLMISCVLASLIASRLRKDSIYTQKLSARGVDINTSPEASVMEKMAASDVMRTGFAVIHPEEPFDEVLHLMLEEDLDEVYILDQEGCLRGSIEISRIRKLARDPKSHELTAEDVAEPTEVTLRPDATLADCMARFSTVSVEQLPIVEEVPQESGGSCRQRMLGYITHRDIFMVYNREVLRRDTGDLRYVYRHERQERSDYVEMPSEHRVDAIPVTSRMVGRTLRDLDLRARYQVNVVAIRSRRFASSAADSDVPNPGRVLGPSDTLIVVGNSKDIDRLKQSLHSVIPNGPNGG
jgi:CIC family chloride channel protein